jgi:hypothetical protein
LFLPFAVIVIPRFLAYPAFNAPERRCGGAAGTHGRVAIHLVMAPSAAGAALGVWAEDPPSVAVKEYDTGGVYEGEFRDGKQHGIGTFRLPGGYEYTGEWVDGRIEGQGTARYPNGSVYEGAFVDGAPHGQGRIVYADGGSYEGEWRERRDRGRGPRGLRRRRDL